MNYTVSKCPNGSDHALVGSDGRIVARRLSGTEAKREARLLNWAGSPGRREIQEAFLRAKAEWTSPAEIIAFPASTRI